ncbi:MAG: hypothetical protein KJ939_02535 [Nanoarchaeota archaeon]|nr:hypothetical protein [Nanoarchaeota archaeon]
MLGKPEWFKRRKYSGWGIIPKTWQGWVYILIFMLPFVVFQALPYWDEKTRITATIVWLVILLIDVSDIMVRMKNDERERLHEAIAERNAAWIMLLVIITGIFYQTIKSALTQTLEVDFFLVGALFAGVIAKMITNFYLDKKN